MIRVLVGDDHPLVRRGIAETLADTSDIVVASEACDGAAVLAQASREKCDLILLDLVLPDRHGLDILEQLRHDGPQIPVLIMSAHAEAQYAARALKAGAAGYLTKDSAPDELVTAIRKVMGGGIYVSRDLVDRLTSHLILNRDAKPHEALSNREHQVLCLIASGEPLVAIAERLSISPKTVSTYRSRILEKMRATSDADLIRYALEHGLLE